MIHKRFPLILVLLFPSYLFSQFEIDKHIAGPSIGFSFLGSTVQYGLNHEYGISLNNLGIDEVGKLGIGGVFRYWDYTEEFTDVKTNYTNILFGIQTNYHFYMANDKVDPWAGVIVAYNFGSADHTIKTVGFKVNKDSHDGFWIGVHAGARYWISSKIGLNIKIGFGIRSYGSLDLGFDYKFN